MLTPFTSDYRHRPCGDWRGVKISQKMQLFQAFIHRDSRNISVFKLNGGIGDLVGLLRVIVASVPVVVVVAERRRPRPLEVSPGFTRKRLFANQHLLRVLKNGV